MRAQHAALQPTSQDTSGRLNAPPSTDILPAHDKHNNSRTHSGHITPVKTSDRGYQTSAVPAKGQGNFPKTQQYIRNPASQASLKTPRMPEPVRAVNTISKFSYPSAPQRTHPADWKSWEELRIRIFRLPPNTTVENLRSWFRAEGEVHFVEIYEARMVDGTCSACLSFRSVSSDFKGVKLADFEIDLHLPILSGTSETI